MDRNIFPKREEFVSRFEKENLLKQKGVVVWFTGLSGSGKSTLAKHLQKRMHQQGRLTEVLDGDKIRHGLNKDLGFSPEARQENIRRIAEVARLFCQSGIITICAFISPSKEIRNMAKQIIGAEDYFEIYLNTPVETCEKRDTKGLYQKARRGEISNFTGISAPYDAPDQARINIDTTDLGIEASVDLIERELLKYMKVGELVVGDL